MCVLLASGCKYGFRANNHDSNPHLYIILVFLQFTCGGEEHDDSGNRGTRKTGALI